MTTTRLFGLEDLDPLVTQQVSVAQAEAIERIVWGWLKPVLGNPTDRPTPVPAELYSWAVELGAIALENPTGLASYQLGAERFQYSTERRREILDDVAKSTLVPEGSGGTAPRGNFPDAADWPDPECGW